MLALSHQQNLYAYTICIVAALSVQELLVDSFDTNSVLVQRRRYWAGTGNSLLLGRLSKQKYISKTRLTSFE